MAHGRKIAIVGLGYVGLTIAAGFGLNEKVLGFDISETRIEELKRGYDLNNELTAEDLKKVDIEYSTDPEDLKKANFFIVTVLTPIDHNHQPDLTILLRATEMLAKRLKKGDIVVYESTVYPGATEEKCIPLLEKISGLKCGVDFGVGYSPERINPGDAQHTFQNITKIVSGVNPETLKIVGDVYASAIPAGVFPVSKIRVAEATKVIENTQRDINISAMNEIALILHSLGMDTAEVIEASKTKWNYLGFQPGLVGGHCIGVNSYYLTYKSEEAGYHPEVITAGRRVNNYIPKFIAQKTIKKLIRQGLAIKDARIGLLGITYKENTPDVHDSRVLDLLKELKSFEPNISIHDPVAYKDKTKHGFNIDLVTWDDLKNLDAVIIAVAHNEYKEKLNKEMLQKMLKPNGIIMDVKSILKPSDFENTKLTLWRL